jgi:cytosine/adenosine deaminase-related metal-dependent hydrolase
MGGRSINRRAVLAASTAVGAASLMARRAFAQGAPAAAPPARGEFVIRGAHVLSMDSAVGDLPVGDVHVRNGAIVAVAASVPAPGAEVIDGKGMICMPGLVETHWHHWTNVCRPFVRNDDPKLGYFPVTAKYGPHYTPEDMYHSVRPGLCEALAAGITTTHNWSHNVRSPAHADAEIRAMHEIGIRGRYAYGPVQGGPNDEPMDLADLARVKKSGLPDDGLTTLGICSRIIGDDSNPTRGVITVEMSKKEWSAARELGLPITLHASGPRITKLLDGAGLLGPDVQFVHPTGTSAEDRAILAAKGVSYSTSPIGESRRPGDAGVIQLPELLESGVKTSLSIDHVTTYNCDLFVGMRLLYSMNLNRLKGKIKITTKRMVELATIDGARDMKLDDKVGSLVPGKRADIILIRATDLNIAPIGDPYDAIVFLAQPGNVDTVIVDGRILRRKNQFTGIDHARIMQDAAATIATLRSKAG